MVKRVVVLGLFIIFFHSSGFTQPESLNIHLNGYAYDSKNPKKRLDDLMIINVRTSQGVFGLADGTFNAYIFKTDTIVISSTGYEFQRICFTDSVIKPQYYIDVPLIKLNVTLKEVNIFSPRDLQSIYTDIKKLGYNKKDNKQS